MQRSIVHIDLDSFFVSVERLLNPELIGKPVAVGGNSARSVVSSCSYEARKFGVRSAMPMLMAKKLCPELIVVKGNYASYTHYSKIITSIIAESVPLYEKTSIDEFYLDLTGTDKFFGSYKLATELRKRITNETGLPISFALSTNKTVSKIGTGEAKPNGQMYIEAGKEKEFLAPLPIQKIPMVGKKTLQILQQYAITKIQDVQKLSAAAMQGMLGNSGIVIWEKANGIDNSPVVPYTERKSISSERTFEKDTSDTKQLLSVLITLTEGLTYQLRNEKKLTTCVAVKIRYDDFTTFTKQESIPATALDSNLIEAVKRLFHSLYTTGKKCRLIGIRFSELRMGEQQINLFEANNNSMKLYEAMDKIKNRFGEKSITRAITTENSNSNLLKD
ncbi:MAG: DNA polymerase IV [Bacteroidia bacterium]|nr:DNA polymerase IV [Bacteroidia bacterium]MCC7533450.1 DNA polymerase IV [Bacteroidia bacterium]